MTKCTDRLLSRGHHSVMAMLLYCEWKSGLSTISGHLLHCMPTITCPRTRVIKIPDNIPRPADPCVQGIHTQEPALIPAVSRRSCSFTRAGHSSKFREMGLTSRPCPRPTSQQGSFPVALLLPLPVWLAQHPRTPREEVTGRTPFSCILTANEIIIDSIAQPIQT